MDVLKHEYDEISDEEHEAWFKVMMLYFEHLESESKTFGNKLNDWTIGTPWTHQTISLDEKFGEFKHPYTEFYDKMCKK